jgi:hypothetical protein
VVRSYRRPSNWAICSWGTFNSRLPPAFPTGWAVPSYGRRSSTGQIKHVAATRWHSTSFRSTSHTVLESVLWKSLDWSWRSASVATPFARNRDEVLRSIMDGAALMRKSREGVRKATSAVLKRAHLCIANAGCNFEQQAAKVRTYIRCHNAR